MGRLAHLDGLTSQRVHWSRRSYLELVIDHVSQSLVVDQTDVDVGRELFTSDTRVHRLIAGIVVPSSEELLAKVLGGTIGVGESAMVVSSL